MHFLLQFSEKYTNLYDCTVVGIHSHFYFSIESSKHSNNPHYTVPFVVTKLIEAVVCVFFSAFYCPFA